MTKIFVAAIALVLAGMLQVSVAKLPSSITPCNRFDPHLDNCIVRAVQSVQPLLANGDLGDGFKTPPLEPLYLDNIEMNRGPQFQATFTDITAYGGTNFIIDSLKANASTTSYEISLLLPKVEFSGKYLLRLQILLLDIQGKGKMSGNFENCKATIKMRGSSYTKNGVDYIRFTKMPMQLIVGDFNLRLENLFNGDKTLGELGNAVINENKQLFLMEIIPSLEKALSQKFLQIANKILESATFDEMFPID